MIKGLGYLKYLKLSLIGFGISCFMVLGGSYVNADYDSVIVNQNGSYVTSSGDSNIQIFVTSRGNLSSMMLGNTRRMLAFKSTQGYRTYFWWYNGVPYFYYYNSSDNVYFQGEGSYYQLCDPLSPGDTTVSNCTLQSITSSFENDVTYFFNSITSSDYFGYYYGPYSDPSSRYGYRYSIRVCFSSAQVGRSICFMSSDGLNPENLGLGRDLSFSDVPEMYLGDPPGWSTSSPDGGVNEMTGNTVDTSCTKSLALQWYRCNGYKTRMCYSSYGNTDDLYTSAGQAQGYDLTGVDIEDVWFNSAWYRRNGSTGTSMGYSEWFDYWRKTYNVYKQNPQHTNPFLGVPVSIFTLMGNVNSYGNPYTSESILEFCDLSLYTANYDKPYTGVAQSAVCSMSPIELVDCQASNGLNSDDGYPGDGTTNGTVGPIGSSWDGITNRTGYHNKPSINTSGTIITGQVATGNDLNTFNDGSVFLNNFFNTLSSKFQYSNNSGSTRIPSYIIIFLCAVILFKFLRK